jgi:HAD superfamily hydrolase (TIGR01549 family)
LIRAVIFDIGGPIDLETQFEAAIDDDIKSGLRGEGFAINDASFREAEKWAVEHYAPSLYRAVIWRLTLGDESKAIRIYNSIETAAAKRDLFELRPGIPSVLETLSEYGLRLGLAANQPRRAIDHLETAGIGHYFKNQGISGVYGVRKPDVRLFLRACEDLQVEPSDCVMVGDRVDNDIVPANLLGMRTTLFRTGRHREQQPRSWDERPDAEVSHVDELLPAILALVERQQ